MISRQLISRDHATQRMMQRSIQPKDIRFVLEYGETQEKIMICIICKQAELQSGTGTSIFERDGMTLVIKEVSKLVCPNCGEEYTDEKTTERLLEIVENAAMNGVLTDIRKYKAA